MVSHSSVMIQTHLHPGTSWSHIFCHHTNIYIQAHHGLTISCIHTNTFTSRHIMVSVIIQSHLHPGTSWFHNNRHLHSGTSWSYSNHTNTFTSRHIISVPCIPQIFKFSLNIYSLLIILISMFSQCIVSLQSTCRSITLLHDIYKL